MTTHQQLAIDRVAQLFSGVKTDTGLDFETGMTDAFYSFPDRQSLNYFQTRLYEMKDMESDPDLIVTCGLD